jgi:lysophospholipase L1-like esterase
MSSEPIDPASPGDARPAVSWPMIGRVFLKGLILFLLLNLVFAALRPLDALGRLSLYNTVFPGRARLPYGEIPADDLNLTLNNLPAMLAAHAWSRPKAGDEFRVLLIGDSGTWGWFLEHDETLAGQLNALDLRAADGRRVVVYNLGFPAMSLTKDLLLLDTALERADADLILWPVTLQSFARGRQLEHPLLGQNAGRVRDLITRHDLALDPADPRFVDRNLLNETLVGRRRDLADLLRLQAYGLAWAATGRDQAIPDEIPPRESDFEADASWLDVPGPRPLTEDDLAFDALRAGVARAGDVPIWIINEPMYVSSGENSDVRYNAFYPRWAYDQYRATLAEMAAAEGWDYLDLWDAIPPEEFTDTPVHLTPEGTRQLAALLAGGLINRDG